MISLIIIDNHRFFSYFITLIDNQFFSTAAAFKFSPSLNGESSVMSKVEREKRLEEMRKVRDFSIRLSHHVRYIKFNTIYIGRGITDIHNASNIS